MSNDRYTEITHQSWGGRLVNSIKGILIGLLLIIAAFPLLWWNEGRAVQRAKSLTEGAAAVVSVPVDSVDETNEGKLIHLTGEATTDETLTDATFGVSVKGLALKRNVEMYQWKEDSQTTTEKKVGGGTEKKTTYTYSKQWSSSLANSSNFKQTVGHENPSSMPYQSETYYTGKATLGGFVFPSKMVARIPANTQIEVSELPESIGKIHGGGAYIGSDPASPTIGDVRVTFKYAPPQTVSLVARQSGTTLVPYETEAGGTIELLSVGTLSADEMFTEAQRQNTILTWVLRFVGFLLMLIGFGAIFKPMVVVADVLPILGSIVGMGTGLAAAIVSAFLSLITIGMAWVFYRPVLGVALLLAGTLIISIGVMAGRNKKQKAKQTT